MSDGEGGDDDDKRASKKRKATRACDRCNSQHQPCDNSLPKCSVCERAGTECTYDRPIRKRGPRVGYTSQNGERLWSVVLRARPEIEDLVLQILRDGTYGDTGVPNAKFIKNNDNQTELVNFFNESRIGRFLQNGDSDDLQIPDPDQQFSIVPTSQLSMNQEQGNGQISRIDGASNASASVGASLINRTGAAGPHGAPQNPGEIYLQSDEIRRRKFPTPNRPVDCASSNDSPDFGSQSVGTAADASSNYGSVDANTWKNIDLFNSYNNAVTPRDIPGTEASVLPKTNSHMASTDYTPANFELTNMGISHWFDPIPTDTLLNLGFGGGGDTMAQDFFELCENPDPVEKHTVSPSATTTTSQGEDEEEVWRRLIMRGRFM